jgi:hypothetical protein
MEDLKDLRVPLRLPNMMRAAGFVDVESRVIQLPTCAWSTGSNELLYHAERKLISCSVPEQRDIEIGAANRENIQRMLSSLAIYPFTERIG